jgi:hypothetical protein
VPYLIDASNLGGALGGARGARDAAAVFDYLRDWARGRGRVVAVFDGEDDGRLARRYGPLEIVWSGAGRPADDVIAARLARGARGWTVVTRDRALARRCRELGATVESPEALARRVERPHPGARRDDTTAEKPAASAADRDHWRKVFGEE